MSVIARTKLEIPPERDGLVPRGALVSLLAGASHTRLTLLSAPAGSGKTTLLQQWHRAAPPGQPFAWLSLDAGDDDPVRFWTCVIEALRMAVPGIGDRAEGALRSHGTSVEDVVVPLLVNELSALPQRLVLVLDDLHTVSDEQIHRSLIAFVERLPATAHVAVATRADPPWPMLPQLRARDQMVEIRSVHMRFSDVEASSYLAGLGLDLAADQVAAIHQRTEGWAAGLQLAGLSLRGNPDVVLPVGDDRHIGDYLAAEVLDRVAPEERRFLLRTSILERMSGQLCDAVTGSAGAATTLAELDRRNLFVVALDGRRQWYRYHHLFADLLRARLAAEEPDAVPDLHVRASRWLASEGDIAEAIGHAIAAGDRRATAQLVAAHWLMFFNHGWLMSVRRWLDSLEPTTIAAEPELWLARTWTAMDLGQLDEVAAWLDRAPDDEDWVGVLGALRLFKLGDVAGAARAAGAAVSVSEPPSVFWRTVAAIVTGVAAYWRGRHADARASLEAAERIAAEQDNALARQYALGYLALDAIAHDGPAAARELLSASPADVAGAAGGAQINEHFTAMMGHLALGRAAELEGQLTEAERELARAGELSRRGAGVLERAAAALAHARVLAALGRREAGRQRLARGRELLAHCADPGILARALAEAERAPGLAPPRAPAAAGEDLSERELGVLRLLHSELSLREIGAELFVSLNTVKTHTRNIYLKLGAGGREEAVARARELGLL